MKILDKTGQIIMHPSPTSYTLVFFWNFCSKVKHIEINFSKMNDDQPKVAGHIPARISDVPSWDAEIFFLYKF
jgi:hypothetical protein